MGAGIEDCCLRKSCLPFTRMRIQLPSRFQGLAGLILVGSALAAAQEAQPLASTNQPAAGRTASDGSIQTQKNARTITLKIPAPRGQIVDREGECLAQNVIAYQVALQFKQFENADRDYVLNWAKSRMETARILVKSVQIPTDDQIYDHYRNRRWLPLLVSDQVSAKDAKSLEPKLGNGLTLHAVYRRYYPEEGIGAHLIGYTGSVGKLPTGPINFNEPLWEESEGRAGLERIYDRQLQGEPGGKRLLFDEAGNRLLEEQTKRPMPGGTVVTTLNLKWQRQAEKVLRKGCKRGAFVVIDVVTGEVLVMASRPTFNLNSFIPGIGEKDYKTLNEDPGQPLFGRAFQSAYPPASTFKPIVALAALNNGTVTGDKQIYCPASIRIGNHEFKNWSRTPEGSIDVKRAIARSCNPWFYQVGIDVGPTAFLGLARRLGYGEKTGLPLIGETQGLVPTNEWMLQHERRRINDGDTANLSIGQGVLLSSPLQVAQGMAGIANGGALPKLQLVRQVQDARGRVIESSRPEKRVWLGVDAKAIETVREGMRDVVNSGYGTGRSAGLSFTELCGKTGTAQWGPPSKEQRLAWFAGFFPFENPRFAFAVLYEGTPGETVSGGRMAGPMVRDFFEPLKDEIKEIIAPPPKALMVIEEADEEKDKEGVLKAQPVEEEEGEDLPLPPKALPVEPDDLPAEELEGL
jgi:penicillin-binding protein 2